MFGFRLDVREGLISRGFEVEFIRVLAINFASFSSDFEDGLMGKTFFTVLKKLGVDI